MPTTGKRSGAYSTGAYDVHPYQLLNFTGSYDDVSTLAHESGHSMHSYLSDKNQPYADRRLLHLRGRGGLDPQREPAPPLHAGPDQGRRHAALPARQPPRRPAQTLFRQTLFAEFELKIHEMAEKGEPLTGDNLTEALPRPRARVLRRRRRASARWTTCTASSGPTSPTSTTTSTSTSTPRASWPPSRSRPTCGPRRRSRAAGDDAEPRRLPQDALRGLLQVPDRPAQGRRRGHDDARPVQRRHEGDERASWTRWRSCWRRSSSPSQPAAPLAGHGPPGPIGPAVPRSGGRAPPRPRSSAGTARSPRAARGRPPPPVSCRRAAGAAAVHHPGAPHDVPSPDLPRRRDRPRRLPHGAGARHRARRRPRIAQVEDRGPVPVRVGLARGPRRHRRPPARSWPRFQGRLGESAGRLLHGALRRGWPRTAPSTGCGSTPCCARTRTRAWAARASCRAWPTSWAWTTPRPSPTCGPRSSRSAPSGSAPSSRRSARLEPYRPWLEDILRYAPHTGTAAEERIVSRAGIMTGAPSETYDIFKAADMPYPEVTLSSGETVRLDDAAYTQYRALPEPRRPAQGVPGVLGTATRTSSARWAPPSTPRSRPTCSTRRCTATPPASRRRCSTRTSPPPSTRSSSPTCTPTCRPCTAT